MRLATLCKDQAEAAISVTSRSDTPADEPVAVNMKETKHVNVIDLSYTITKDTHAGAEHRDDSSWRYREYPRHIGGTYYVILVLNS